MSLQKGLVLHVPLNQESYNSATKRFSDKTPYSNHGTSNNAASFTTDRMGNSNQATTFDGASDYVNCGNDESLDITGAISLCFWFKNNDILQDNKYIFSKSLADANSQFNPHIRNGVDLRHMWGGGAAYDTLEVVGIMTDSWNHFVLIVDSNFGKVYKNGEEVGSKVNTIGLDIGSDTLYMGSYTGGAAQYVSFSTSDVRTYNRALTQSEITSLYESYKPQTSIGSASKGLVLDMPMRNPYTKDVSVAGSEVLTDRTPYSNDGTNHGATISSDPAVFNGSSDYVDCGNDSSLNIIDAITIGAWVKPVSGASTYDFVWKTHMAIFEIHANLTDIQVWLYIDGAYRSSNAVSIDMNVYSLFVFTYNSNTQKIITYIDGCEAGTTTLSGLGSYTINPSGNDVIIGSRGASGTNTLDGIIADVRIYNRALSAREIKKQYDSTKYKYL